jgi:hypothetical protein
MTEELEEVPKDGSVESDMAQKMADDIGATISRSVHIIRATGIKDPDLRDIILSALMHNVVKAEIELGCIGDADGILAGQRSDFQKQLDEGRRPT